MVTWPRRIPEKWLSSNCDERTFPTLAEFKLFVFFYQLFLLLVFDSIASFCDVVNLHMRRRRPFLQEMTAFSEKMIVAARLMVTMMTTMMTMLTMITMTMMTMMTMMTDLPLGS